MSARLSEIEKQVQSLPAEDRARLAEILLESLRGSAVAEIEEAWEREIRERVAAYDRGEVTTTASEEVFAEARRLAR